MVIKELENRIINSDCLEILKQLPDKCIDCFFSDIPYRISQCGCSTSSSFGSKKKYANDPKKLELYKNGKLFSENDIKPEQYLPDVYRVMKDKAHGYIMTNSSNLKDVMQKIEDSHFIINNVLVMRKNNCVTNQWYMKDIEFTIFFRKGGAKPLNDCGIKSCLDVIMPQDKIHETQKPVSYVQVLIENSTQVGDLILDPFSGSGTTAIACHRLKRRFICIELDKEYFNASVKRLEDEQRQGVLF